MRLVAGYDWLMDLWGKLKQKFAHMLSEYKHNRFHGRGNFRCRYCGVIAWESWCSDDHYEAYQREHASKG